MTLQALQNCVIVRPEIEKHALFDLLRAGRTGFGEVLAVGPEAFDAKVGDRVLFGEFVGQDFTFEGENLLVMRDEHILGVYEQ